MSQEYIQLKAFKWSVTGKAQTWLESLPPRSITTWGQLYDLFMTKFFLPAKTTELRARITSYRQAPGESFVDTWERFKDLLNKCPTHGQAPYVLQQIFFQGIDAGTRARLNLHTACGFLEMDPTEAWALIDKLTSYDAMYEIPFSTPIAGQAQADETNRLREQVSSLKACQLCNSMNHTASFCTNMKQVLAAESYQHEEVRYARDAYPTNRSYPPKNVPYPNRDAYPPGPRGPPPSYEQRVPPPAQPYRHPGYQEQARPPMPSNEDLRGLILDMSHKLDLDRRTHAEEIQGVRAQLKGVNAHLGDLDTWKKNVDTQLGHVSQRFLAPKGNFRAVLMRTREATSLL